MRFLLALLITLGAGSAVAQQGNARAEALAKQSTNAARAMATLRAHAARIKAPAVRAVVSAMLDNPAPTFMMRHREPAARQAVRTALVNEGLLDAAVTVDQLFAPLADPMRAPMSFAAAPGGTPDKHHSYPGGLAEHTLFNVEAALALAQLYGKQYGVTHIDQDEIIAGAVLHDALKPWCLQWTDAGEMTTQASVGGTSSHHSFIVAEAIHRKLPASLVVTIAAAHDPPTLDAAAKVVRCLRAGALLAGADPVALGLLTRDGATYALARPPSFEAAINHLSDHDYIFTDAAGPAIAAALDRLVRADDPKASPAELRWRRLAIETRVPSVRLYEAWLRGGDPAVRELIK